MRSVRGWTRFIIFGLASLAALFVAAAIEFGLTTPVRMDIPTLRVAVVGFSVAFPSREQT